jgi:NAD(P)-dependent dehydrogenase (short-subunit alcohol dehydrogenase family)
MTGTVLRPDLAGRTAIVTGAGGAGVGGLGVTFATALAQAGAAVVVADIDGGAADRVAKALVENGWRAVACQTDVTSDDDAHSMVNVATANFGGVDILVNNAGFARGHWNLGIELGTDEWLRILALNTVAPLICARACRTSMAARGGGVIINITSSGAYGETGAYSVSKVALASMTNVLSAELGPEHIRVNAIAPGMMTSQLPPDQVAAVLRMQKVQRAGSPQDLVGALLYLCSEDSSFVTGTTLRVDGGMTRGHL